MLPDSLEYTDPGISISVILIPANFRVSHFHWFNVTFCTKAILYLFYFFFLSADVHLKKYYHVDNVPVVLLLATSREQQFKVNIPTTNIPACLWDRTQVLNVPSQMFYLLIHLW